MIILYLFLVQSVHYREHDVQFFSIKVLLPIKKMKMTRRVCLFGGGIGWMENFGEKMGRKTFLECVWLGGEKENK